MAFAVGYKTFVHNATTAQNVALTGFTDVVGSIGTLQSNDLVLVWYNHFSNGARTLGQCLPAGYMAANPTVVTASDNTISSALLSYKRQPATPDASVAIPPTNSTIFFVVGYIVVVRDADFTALSDATIASGINGGRPIPPGVTPSATGSYILGFGGSGDATSNAAFTQAGDYNHFDSFYTTGGRHGVSGFGLKTDWASGTFSAGAWTGSTAAATASWVACSVALRPKGTGGAGEPPAIVSVGDAVSGAMTSGGSLIVPLPPTYSPGDRLFLQLENAYQSVNALVDWDELPGSPFFTDTNASGSSTATLMRVRTRIADGTETSPVLTWATAGDHIIAYTFATSPCEVDATASSVNNSSSLTVNYPALSTTVDNTLVVVMATTVTDVATSRHTSISNGFTALTDASTASGNGGGVFAATKVQATAGLIGTTAGAIATSSQQTRYAMALKNTTGGGGATLTPSLVTNTQTFYGPTVTRGAVTLSPALLTNTSSFFAATVTPSYTLAPALLNDGDTFFAPTVTPGAASLQPGLLTNTSTFYAPTALSDAVLAPPLLTNTQTFSAPTVTPSYSLTAPLIGSTSALFAPIVSTGAVIIVPPLISDGDTFFSPTVIPATVNVSPPLLANAQIFYGAVVTSDGALSPPLLTNGQTFFAPSISTGPVQLAAPLISDPDVFFGGAVAVGSVTISPALLANQSVFFGPSVEVGQVDLAPPLVANDNHFFTAEVVVSTDQQLLANLYENVVVFPTPSVRVFRVATASRPTGETTYTRPEQLSSARPIAMPTTRPGQSTTTTRPKAISTGRRR